MLGNSWLTTSLLAAVERELHSEYTRAAYAYEDLARGLPGVITPENVATLGPVYLGFEPRAVHGGAFALQDGLVTHPVYGTFVDAVFPKLPIEGSPLTAALQSTQGVGASLDFEGQGNHRGLRVRAHLGK